MFRKSVIICSSLALAIPLALAQDAAPSRAKLSAADVVAKNVAARGGLQAWRAVQTVSLSGKMGAGGNQRATLAVPNPDPARRPSQQVYAARPVDEVQLPFVMELKRPRKMRVELEFNSQTAVQVFDGTNGWKLRPYLGRRVVEPYTVDEMKVASMQADLDGPLVDYAAKGTQIELAGMEKVEDRDTYNIKLTMKNGTALHVWIDAQTFLEAKIEGQPRRLDGTDHPVEIYFSDYRPVQGLMIPFVLETRVLPVAQTAMGTKDPAVPPEKTIITKVVVNPRLDDSRFLKPEIEVAASNQR
jgi:hypothetical protein